VKVRLIKKKTIIVYCQKTPNIKNAFDLWLGKLKYADWQNANDIKQTYGSADILGRQSNRVVFNIGGNKFRMICKYHFGNKNVHLFVNWIGTHKEYNVLCDKNLQYTVNKY
jgi:mRNA interferase HigB